MMYRAQEAKRDRQIHELFSKGLAATGIGPERIPDLVEVNRRLRERTGFEGVPVEGLEEDAPFYRALAERKFPIGNFIRDRNDLAYTPAPDVFHDLYGHLPFLADPAYADFCAELGRKASLVAQDREALDRWARLFWFAIEFALIETRAGDRIFGAGIASSIGECDYALSAEPEVVDFDPRVIARTPFKIDEFQRKLFRIRKLEDLYGCLKDYG